MTDGSTVTLMIGVGWATVDWMDQIGGSSYGGFFDITGRSADGSQTGR